MTETITDQDRARAILREVWAHEAGRSLTESEYDWLQRFATVPEETAIDIALRVAGLAWDWRNIVMTERAKFLHKKLGGVA